MRRRRLIIGFGAAAAGAVGVLLSSPNFWSLINMSYGAEPVTAVLADGSTVTSMIGPKSPWPDWAIGPEGGAMTVRSSTLDTVGVASGHAEFTAPREAAAIQTAYAQALRSGGWTVRLFVVPVTPPDIAPRRSRLCVVEGRRAGETLRLSVDAWTANPTRGAVFWRTAPGPPLMGASEGAC